MRQPNSAFRVILALSTGLGLGLLILFGVIFVIDTARAGTAQAPTVCDGPSPLVDAPVSLGAPSSEVLPKPEARPWDIPNECESIARKVWSEKQQRFFFKRDRQPMSIRERDRIREVIRLVASEMGSDDRYLLAKSTIEASQNPSASHVLNPDFEANKSTWSRFTYSEEREAELLRIQKRGVHQRAYWTAKAELARIRTYKDNPYWNATVLVDVEGPRDLRFQEPVSVWSFGYGLYGMNSVYYTSAWDPLAPPWVLCADDGVVATVIEVWALRDGLAECVSQGYPNTWDTANVRVSRGKCGADLGEKYLRWSKRVDLDRGGPPRLGKKWRKSDSDRDQLLAHMRRRVAEECLTPELYRQPACANTSARGFERK